MDMKNPTDEPGMFRKTLGRFASGVTILTTAADERVYGMTANAFCSVSLTPPLVLTSVNNSSRMHTVLKRSGWYGVSILARQQEGLSRHFSGRPRDRVDVPFVWHEGCPLIEGALAWLICRVVETHLAGDHTLYLGQVESLGCSEEAPLVFYAGRYQSLERGEVSFATALSQSDMRSGFPLPSLTPGDLLLCEPSWW